MVNLTEKERKLLEDEKSHEKLCIEKYTKYSQLANDPQLKTMFNSIGEKEQQHLQTINKILTGTVPNLAPQSATKQTQEKQPTAFYTMASPHKEQDAYLCTDALSTEKFVSSTYNTAIFEFKDKNIRNVLNNIQKEEQEHGDQIYNYMAANSMYN